MKRCCEIFCLLIMLLLWHHPVMAQKDQVIRIGLAMERTEIGITAGSTASLLDLSGNEPVTVPLPGEQLIFTANGGETIFINSQPQGKGPFLVVPGSDLLGWSNRTYRGALLIQRASSGKLNLVNRVGLEDYLRGVLPGEISPKWAMAAVKAQAIAARSYTIASMPRHNSQNFDLCSTDHCQVYVGASAEHPNSDQAVAETAGQVITYNNKVIYAYYHDASGGYTEDSVYIWGNSVPYLKPEPDWDFNAPRYQWTRAVNWSDLQAWTSRLYPAIGRLKRIVPATFGQGGKVLTLTLIGDLGELIINGEQFRRLAGIWSNNFQLGVIYGPEPFITLWWLHGEVRPEALTANKEIPGLTADLLNPPWGAPDPWGWLQDKEPVTLVVKGAGWGHGIGLSQWGAKGMAEAGYNEIQILQHYYPGTAISLLENLK